MTFPRFCNPLQMPVTITTVIRAVQIIDHGCVRVYLLGGFFNDDGLRVRKINIINIFGLSSYL